MAHLHAPGPHRDPNGIHRRAPSGSVQRAAEPAAGPAARPTDARLLGIPGAAREQVMLQLQRQHGNRLVQSLLAPQPVGLTTVQAEGLADDEEMQAEGAEEEEIQAEGEEEELQMEGAEEEEIQAEGAGEEELQAEGEEEELQAEGEEEEEAVQMAGAEGVLQRRAAGVSSRLRAARGGGSALDGPTLQRMDSSFGQSFDHVRVHTDAGADSMARDLNAKAFTNGSDVFFRAGQYAPGTTAGDHLIAHELTHVVQQGQGLVPTGHQSSGGAAGRTPGDTFEQEAATTADAVTTGRPLPGATPATVQRKRE